MSSTATATVTITSDDVTKDEPQKIVSPRNPNPKETIFLSNIDLAVAFTVETIYFFEVNREEKEKEKEREREICRIVKKALKVILVPYYFMAGRLNLNKENGRLELDCNNNGVLFVKAKSRVLLKEIGDLSLPNPSFHCFVHRPGLHGSFNERALFTVQKEKTTRRRRIREKINKKRRRKKNCTKEDVDEDPTKIQRRRRKRADGSGGGRQYHRRRRE